MGFLVFLLFVGLLIYWHFRLKTLSEKFDILEKDIAALKKEICRIYHCCHRLKTTGKIPGSFHVQLQKK